MSRHEEKKILWKERKKKKIRKNSEWNLALYITNRIHTKPGTTATAAATAAAARRTSRYEKRQKKSTYGMGKQEEKKKNSEMTLTARPRCRGTSFEPHTIDHHFTVDFSAGF